MDLQTLVKLKAGAVSLACCAKIWLPKFRYYTAHRHEEGDLQVLIRELGLCVRRHKLHPTKGMLSHVGRTRQQHGGCLQLVSRGKRRVCANQKSRAVMATARDVRC